METAEALRDGYFVGPPPATRPRQTAPGKEHLGMARTPRDSESADFRGLQQIASNFARAPSDRWSGRGTGATQEPSPCLPRQTETIRIPLRGQPLVEARGCAVALGLEQHPDSLLLFRCPFQQDRKRTDGPGAFHWSQVERRARAGMNGPGQRDPAALVNRRLNSRGLCESGHRQQA
jgi:hypothetical protein